MRTKPGCCIDWLMIAGLAVALSPASLAQQPAAETGLLMATAEQMAATEAAAEPRARELVHQLRDFVTFDQNQAELLQMRPLPPAAAKALMARITEKTKKDKAAVWRSAQVLAYHEFDPEGTRQAIVAVRTKLKSSDQAAVLLDGTLEYLAKVASPQTRAVLADSDEFETLLRQAVRRTVKPPPAERQAPTQPGMVTTFSVRSFGPPIEDLPLRLTISNGGSECGVTLGWEWRFEEKEIRVPFGSASRTDDLAEPPQIGALARISRGACKLNHSELPGGLILRRASGGWSPIGSDEAVKGLGNALAVRKTVGMPDHTSLAILGAAVMGSAASALVPALTERGLEDAQWARRAAIAVERIGDKAALPALRQLAGRYAGQPWVRQTIDAIAARLERAP